MISITYNLPKLGLLILFCYLFGTVTAQFILADMRGKNFIFSVLIMIFSFVGLSLLVSQ